jgi:hypothetical protein
MTVSHHMGFPVYNFVLLKFLISWKIICLTMFLVHNHLNGCFFQMFCLLSHWSASCLGLTVLQLFVIVAQNLGAMMCSHFKGFFLVINYYRSLLFLTNWSRFTSQWLVMKSGNVCPNNHLDGFIIEWNLSWIPFHWRDNCKSLCKQESLTFLLSARF